MKTSLLVIVSTELWLTGCKERIIEYRIEEPDGQQFPSDTFHGTIVGRVVQQNSRAMVIVSQEKVIDSTLINPSDGSFVIPNLKMGNYDLTIRADNYRLYTRSNIMIQGGGVTFAGEIDLSTVPDLVVQHSPANNSEIVYSRTSGSLLLISIMFSRPMDRASVEKAFSTEPTSEGIFYWGQYSSSSVSYPYADPTNAGNQTGGTITTYSKITSVRYVMSPKDSFSDTIYVVKLSTEAKDTSGNRLGFPLYFTFRTVQSSTTINGIQTYPIHGDMNVSPLSSAGIRITFPRRMNSGSTELATTVTPVMNTTFLWRQENEMIIYTGGPFLSDTTITVSISGNALDKDGIPLGTPFTFWFRTAPLKVSSVVPANAQLFVDPSQRINISFNSYILLSSVQSGFLISPPVDGSFYYSGWSNFVLPNQIIFEPSGSLLPNTKYTVTLSTSIKDMYDVPLKEPYTFSFVTRPN